MHVLIVKHGALGDVVRTSYFAGALRRQWGEQLRLSWLTASAAAPLLRFHPDIDDLWTGFGDARRLSFDRVYSLDDEREVLEGVAQLEAHQVTGACLRDGVACYSDDAAEWFDMGLLSRYGKGKADDLKRRNEAGHAQIFARMFRVPDVEPAFFGNQRLEQWARGEFAGRHPLVGINPFAGGRWPSKELRPSELEQLIDALLAGRTAVGPGCTVVLLGAGGDRRRNLALAESRDQARVLVPDTDDTVLRLAAVIGCLDFLITSDSLAMHLGIAQKVRTVAFFAPTSAPEIDDFGRVTKVVSTAADYCSYRRDADNSTITAERVLLGVASALGLT